MFGGIERLRYDHRAFCAAPCSETDGGGDVFTHQTRKYVPTKKATKAPTMNVIRLPVASAGLLITSITLMAT